ncbi:hypothetical protein STCU_02160 [Strigomonas culicis]|uniref:J domain-containing protein n=1 Tax=Strigomonas culicis TaxID=28005 RepID=S9UXU4_9TRYP|nr:hypothetical protein STCU_02160 [Strigomonas culicis]|eukprot:EPY33554.1 hypothetical protein STCU_02160 [Strigomonas culicis]
MRTSALLFTRSFGGRRRAALITSMAAPRAALVSGPAVGAAALQCQRRWQYAQSGKREHEAFLSQYDPMEVLGIEPDCNVDDIDAAFAAKKALYGPKGRSPDAKMVERVFRAHEILKDPESPYYLKAHSSQTDRQRLQFQLLPKSKRRLIEVQVGILMCIALAIGMMVVAMCFQPVQKAKRAALR